MLLSAEMQQISHESLQSSLCLQPRISAASLERSAASLERCSRSLETQGNRGQQSRAEQSRAELQRDPLHLFAANESLDAQQEAKQYLIAPHSEAKLF
jgi:hypothetical protein